MMATLVMWMTVGFAMLEAGLLEQKNNSIVLLKLVVASTNMAAAAGAVTMI
jgi:ammonia channel protein AmtB